MNVCSICTAGPTKRDAVNAALIEGLTVRNIAAQHGVSSAAVERHRKKCVAAHVAKARSAADELSAESLLRTLQDVQAKAEEIYAANRGTDDGLCLKALQRIQGVVEASVRIAEVIQQAKMQSETKGSYVDMIQSARKRLAQAQADDQAKMEKRIEAEVQRRVAQRALPAAVLDAEPCEEPGSPEHTATPAAS